MKKPVSILVVMTAVALIFVSIVPGSRAALQGKGKSPNSKAVYQNQCAKCHGEDGKGIPSLPDIPNFADAKWQSSHSDKQISDVIAVGAGIMPGFKDVVSATEIRALVKQVRAFSPAAAKSKGK